MGENKFLLKLTNSILESTKQQENHIVINEKLLNDIDTGLDVLLERKQPDRPDCFLSQAQIDEHYDVHYQGYVDGYLMAKKTLEQVSYSDTVEYRNAMLDISFNFNGVLLHELYFESLGKSDPTEKLSEMINDSFGDHENLTKALKAAMMGSRGWVILGNNSIDDKLSLSIIDSHDSHAMIITPILALDVWEHAYYIDYKSDKERYVDALIDDIDWDAVGKRIS